MDRRCTVPVYERIHAAKGAVLLIHGFCSNRATFNVGGGNGKAGASFFEFLAQRGYDTWVYHSFPILPNVFTFVRYAIDLRGTRQAQALGAASPGFITEHIEIDVPAAISAIKKIGHEKVYLIGHSMGGAISCAVAGLIPHDVAGVVHMAGLYHLTLPILADVVELYRAVCPKQLQNFLTSGTTYAIRSLYGMLSPTVSAISSAITQERDAAISPPSVSMFHPAAQTSVSTRSAAAFVYYVIAYIRRKHIPVRSVADAFLFAKRFLPDFVSNMVMNMLYPSPWLPYSVEDPALFVDNTLESPTVGVFLSIGTSSLHKDVFNQWLADSSVHRSEIPNSTKSEDDLTGDLKTLRSNSQAKADSAHSRKVEENTEKSGASRVDPPSICIPNSILPNPPCGTAGKLEPGKAKDSYSFHHKWNELGPYLEQFERLQQMPLFFCPANADAILRSEDSLAGYLRSGSKWKEVIEYRDIKVKKTTPSIKSSTNSMGHPVGNISHPTNLTVSEIEQFGDMLGQQDGDKLDLKKLKRVLSGSSVAKSALYNPASSAGVRSGANKVSGECHNTVTGKSGQLEFAVEDDFDMSSLMKPRYAVPSSLRKHIKFVNEYVKFYDGPNALALAQPAAVSELDILKKNHKFLRDDDEDSDNRDYASWEMRIAKKYYDKLFKEFAIANLERYKEGRVALRWRTKKEVISGIGQFTCANTKCKCRGPYLPSDTPIMAKSGGASAVHTGRHQPGLKSWEVNFAYKEHGEHKNALVKIRLCPECSDMLNYKKNLEKAAEKHRLKRKQKKEKRDERKRQKQPEIGDDDAPSEGEGEESADSDESHNISDKKSDDPAETLASKIWSAPQKLETEKTKDQEMDDFFDSIF
ncbi:hypothetical protein HDU84_002961 [Entophlyctis sp. JEL0112]|nr:hypothetical protein HDU84_002961 [Entophlyctis sp. JEL0112]